MPKILNIYTCTYVFVSAHSSYNLSEWNSQRKLPVESCACISSMNSTEYIEFSVFLVRVRHIRTQRPHVWLLAHLATWCVMCVCAFLMNESGGGVVVTSKLMPKNQSTHFNIYVCDFFTVNIMNSHCPNTNDMCISMQYKLMDCALILFKCLKIRSNHLDIFNSMPIDNLSLHCYQPAFDRLCVVSIFNQFLRFHADIVNKQITNISMYR